MITAGRFAICLPWTLCCAAAIAQDRDKETPPSVEPVLEEVIVTTTRRLESAQDVPISMVPFSGNELADASVTRGVDLIGLVPNLIGEMPYNRVMPSFFIRGIGSAQFNPNSNSKVGIYVDDVYLDSVGLHGGQMFDLQRIEVARGPQGYLFGQNTTAGLIRSITRKPFVGSGTHGDVSVGYGRFDERDIDAALGFDTGNHSAMRIAITTQNRDGTVRNTFTQTDEAEVDSKAARVQWLWQPLEGMELLLNAHGSHDDGGLAGFQQIGLLDPTTGQPCAKPRPGSPCTDIFGYSDSADTHSGEWNVPHQFGRVHAGGGSATLNWTLPRFVFTSVSAYESSRFEINEDTDATPIDLFHGSYLTRPRQFSQEIRLTSNDEARLRWLAGLYYFRENMDGGIHYASPALGPGGLSGVGSTLEGIGQLSSLRTRSAAVFGTVQYAMGGNGKISLGVRYTHESKSLKYAAYLTDATGIDSNTVFNVEDIPRIALFQTFAITPSKSWNNLSGRISYDYRIRPEVMGYASIARGFNSGNFNGGGFSDPNETGLVDPETLLSYEVGMKSEWAGGRLRLNMSTYYYDFSNQQVFVFGGGAGGGNVQRLDNAASSTAYGAEGELGWRPDNHWLLQAGVGVMRAHFDRFNDPLGQGNLSGKELPSTPHLNSTLLVHYEWPWLGGVSELEADTKYTGAQYFSVNNDPTTRADAYWLTNLRATHTLTGSHVAISLWMRNVTNVEYPGVILNLSNLALNEWIPMPPRTYGVSLSWHY